jgi:hypothetical protein
MRQSTFYDNTGVMIKSTDIASANAVIYCFLQQFLHGKVISEIKPTNNPAKNPLESSERASVLSRSSLLRPFGKWRSYSTRPSVFRFAPAP